MSPTAVRSGRGSGAMTGRARIARMESSGAPISFGPSLVGVQASSASHALRQQLLRMKHVEAWRGSGEAQLLPAFDHPVIGGAAQQGGLRKLLEMLVRLARVDQDLRSIRPRLRRKLAGIEPGRPGGAQQVEILGRMTARAQRP